MVPQLATAFVLASDDGWASARMHGFDGPVSRTTSSRSTLHGRRSLMTIVRGDLRRLRTSHAPQGSTALLSYGGSFFDSEVVIGAAMDEFERLAFTATGRAGCRHAAGFSALRRSVPPPRIEAVSSVRREDRHRQAVGLDALLVEIDLVIFLKRAGDVSKGLVPGCRCL